jgi:SAM-dependent methyltransferase
MSSALEKGDRWSTSNGAMALLRDRGVRGIVSEIRNRGVRGLASYATRKARYVLCRELGRRWDRKFGVDTGGQVELEGLAVVGANKALGAPAVSTSPKTFRYLSRYFPETPENHVYVDVGSGKGRTLIMAAELGFRRITGVEFSGDLCDKARENAAAYVLRRQTRASFSIMNADATACALPQDDCVLYFGNPFALTLWPSMIANLERSLAETPRKLTLILAGSQENTIRGAADLLSKSHSLAHVASGTAPYFLDTYLPYHFTVFAAEHGRA